ncbi:hypothetical protein [Sorangium sp. So ce1389]|uniref:hypothetical protein n=1 Tax=Sorangium sp. So ce1389 TaxID=3133336 RepID=UPI003F5F0901
MHAKAASLEHVSVWLGHESVQTADRYIRVGLTATSAQGWPGISGLVSAQEIIRTPGKN